MPPKKKEAQKMSLGTFLNEPSFGGSWADEVEETVGTQPLPAPEHSRGGMSMGYGSSGGYGGDRGYHRDSGPAQLPTRPPYTAHLGNLPYDATSDGVTEFFQACDVISVRIIEDRELQRPKGFAYVEFRELDGLKKALQFDGESFNGRYIKVKIADPPREGRGGDSTRDFGDWTRKGPLPDLPRENNRRQHDFGERRESRDHAEGGRTRDLGSWERKGPLSPLPHTEAPPMSREGSRARTSEHPDAMRNRHQSPAWGEGRQDGSRPPHREFRDKPERVPTAAERDNQWRSNMRPGPRPASPSQSRDGSEAPPSPAAAPAAPPSRPRLNLAKRTVSEATDLPSPAQAGESKASIFGGAKPIDTSAREREIEERRQQAIKEKREAEEKAKEERRLAKEAAAKEAAAKAEAEAEAAAKKKEEEEAAKAAAAEEKPTTEAPAAEPAKDGEQAEEKATDDSVSKEQKLASRPREPRADFKSRATESGNWRRPSGDHGAPRGAPSGPRRGGGGPRGGRHEGTRPPRANGAYQQQQQQQQQPPRTPVTAEPAQPTQDEDGWTTVQAGRRK